VTRIVVLDGYALNPGDLTWDDLRSLGQTEVYDRTPEAEVPARARGAQVILTNKTPVRASALAQLPDLRYIGVLATGYDVVDAKQARERGIVVTNVPTYGTNSVAQFTFALLLELCHRVEWHAADVRAGGWARNPDWSYHLSPLIELAGRTMGIIGYGRIGRQVGAIAEAFGMKVLAHDPMQPDSAPLEAVLREADIVSLHCPLTPDNRGLMNAERIAMMKRSAFLINTARGPLVVEQDLAAALNEGRLAAAALDVVSREPIAPDNPLLSAQNCLLTPHIAWATREARARLMAVAVENVSAFLQGESANVVN
jgi:glycerate dehydrogenase